eukprot:scaffold28661_cov41-Phaeocystis_antarctica.AAC.2
MGVRCSVLASLMRSGASPTEILAITCSVGGGEGEGDGSEGSSREGGGGEGGVVRAMEAKARVGAGIWRRSWR